MSVSVSLRLPTLPEEVTASWLGSVLEQKVKSIETTKIILDQTASKLFVTITYEDEAIDKPRPTHVCIKGCFNPAMLAMPGYREILIDMYTREAIFYNKVAPKITSATLPKAWWTAAAAEQAQGIVIMDDLARAGCSFGDPEEPWPLARVLAGVEQLAAVHAGTWGMSAADLGGFEPAYEQVLYSLTMPWEAMILAADRPPVPDSVRDQARTQAAIRKHFATKNPKFISFLHGDPHPGNTFLGADDRPFFLDWQTAHIGSCFHDFAYFVVGALSVDDRRQHEMLVVDHYLRAIEKLGGPSFRADDPEVLVEYHKSTLSGIGWFLTPYAMQRKEHVMAICERYCAAMVDHRTIELIESLPEPK